MSEPTILEAVLSSISPFTDAELHRVSGFFKPLSAAKNQILLGAGEVCGQFYVVHEGCLRTFFVAGDGSEKTRLLLPAYSVGTALTSFLLQKPSFECIDALEDSAAWALGHADFLQLNAESAEWRLCYQKMLELAYTFQNTKLEQLVTLSARERYELLQRDNPKLLQTVSNRVIASYLDMAPETLSRIKSSRI